MPSRRGLRQIAGILPHAKLIIMVLLGVVRNVMNWFSFTWNGNVQEIWNLPGPEPSFTAKYHFDYWLKNVLSLVVLFRNYTTHLHLLFYFVMLYPVLTGERPRLMLPWLYLQMAKNIVTDVICTFAGVLLCWILHSCGLMALEFLVVRIISTMPSIYLWRRLWSYYFDLYYAELDGENSLPVMKANQGLTLAQRRRATKSLDVTMPIITSSDNRERFNSCVTYDEFFGPPNWEAVSENKASKSLTTLLTIESQESDEAEDDSSLQIIDDENLTLAEKTLKILGLTREEVNANASQMQKTTSTTDLGKSGTSSFEPCSTDGDMESLCFSVTGETVEFRAVGIQVCLPNLAKSNGSNEVFHLSGETATGLSKKCECCEETKCSKENDTDSDDEETQTTNHSTKMIREKPLDCCDKNRKGKDKHLEEEMDENKAGNNPKTVSTKSTYYEDDLYPDSGLQVFVKSDSIAWENLKEINFVSVIDKVLSNEIKPFSLQRDCQNPEKSIRKTFEHLFKDSEDKFSFQVNQNIKEIIPEHEDGTKFICRLEKSPNVDLAAFSGPTSASFGVESDILAINTSYIFEKMPNSDTQSFDSITAAPIKQLIRPDHDSEFDSYFKSSFQRHSNMFDDTRAQFEPLTALQGKADFSNHRAAHRINEDSRSYQTDRNSVEEKTDCSSYSLGLYRSRYSSPQYPPDNYDGCDFDRGNLTGNEVVVVRDIPEITKSKDLENEQITTDLKVHSSLLQMGEKILSSSATSSVKEINELTRASQTSCMKIPKRDHSATPVIAKDGSMDGEKSSHSKNSRKKSSKDRQFSASSSRMSRSSKNRGTPEERETKEMQALRAYNEKTLLKYKREMDARNRDERVQDKFSDPLARQSPGNRSNQDFYVPSVPEKELILNIENAYARFARSKPVDPANAETLHGNFVARDFLDIYSGNGRLKKDSREIKINDKITMRKQHSKYSKLSGGINEFDVTSRSCKLIEGSQKGRELDRTLAKENIRAQNVEVYFFDRQIEDKPSTSKNVPIITIIKSFSREIGADLVSIESSEILTPQRTPSPMVELLNNPEEIPRRIEDSEYYRQLRKKTLPRSVKEAVNNIDWSFQRPISDGSNRRKEKLAHDSSSRITRVDMSSERQDIVQKTTENMLQSVFANGENSERGFRLGESADEFYPIFNTVVVAMEEIIRAAALRGYTDGFISQPATDIEIPEIDEGNLYGLPNSSFEPIRRRSFSGFVRCCILPEDNRPLKKLSKNGEPPSITTSKPTDLREKKREAFRCETDPLDQDESTSVENEESFFLLSKLISSTEPTSANVNIPVIGAEDLPEKPEDTSCDLPSSEVRDFQDHSSFPFEDSLAWEKSPISTRCHSPENALQVEQKTKRIIPERVRLALHNIIFRSSSQKIADKNEPEFEFDLSSYRSILDHFNTGGQELQSIVFEFFDQFPNSVRNGGFGPEAIPRSLKSSEFIPRLQMLTNLYAIEAKVGEIMSVSEETASSSAGNSSFEQDAQPGRETTETGTSGTANFEITTTNTSTGSRDFWRKDDRDKEENNEKIRRVVGEKDGNTISRASSSEIFDKPSDDDKRLLSNILEPDSVSITNSELLNRAIFKREVISSGFVHAIKQSASLSDSAKGTEVEILVTNDEDRKVENQTFTPNYLELIEIQSRNLVDPEPEAEMPELWITDDEEPTSSRSAMACAVNNFFFNDSDNATSDEVLRDIKTAESAIKRMKTLFEQFFAEDPTRKERSKEHETSSEMNSKVSSLTNLRLPVKGELEKLQNLVQTVANYVTIVRSSSTQSFKSSNEPVESHVQRKEPNAGRGSESSDNLEDTPEILLKNGQNCYTDDYQTARVSVPKFRSSPKNSEGPVRLRGQIGGFSSWDRVIPLSTKRQIAKSNRKTKPKKVVAAREPARRIVKVVNLTEEKSVDFFGARSVPQRGRGLSSGYLMDSDSDGNFTVSRPPTPASVESETSLTLSGDNDDQHGVSPSPSKISGSFPMSDTSQSPTTNSPVKTWNSSSANQMKEEFLTTKSPNSMNNSTEKSGDAIESLPIQESLEKSRSLLMIDAEASSRGESARLEIVDGDKNTQNASCNQEMHVLGVESLSTASDLQYMTFVDAVGIENELKDVVQKILSHQFREVNHSMNGYRIGSRNASFTSVSDCTRTESSADLQSNKCNPKDDLKEQKPREQDCHQRIQELLSETEDTSFEQLNAHYRCIDSTSRNSDAVSIEVTARKSRVSVKNASIETDYSMEVFKDLLDMFEKVRSIEEKTMPTGQTSKSCELENGNDAHNHRPINDGDEREIVESNSDFRNRALPMTERNTSGTTSSKTLENMPADSLEGISLKKTSTKISYDSFISIFSQNTTEASEPSGKAISISNNTNLEDFPEQVDSRFQFPLKIHDVDSTVSISESVEFGLGNFEESNNHVAAAEPSSSKSDDKSKKDVPLKKRGIPRLVKGSKERK